MVRERTSSFRIIFYFKLSSCFACRMLSSGLFPSVCSLNANVSEHCVCSIFIGLCVDQCLHNLFTAPAPTPTTSGRGTQVSFGTFHVLYPTFSTAVTLHTHSPMKMEHTQCSETLPFKLQTLGNNPEETIQL
jgi:hypothetical protein